MTVWSVVRAELVGGDQDRRIARPRSAPAGPSSRNVARAVGRVVASAVIAGMPGTLSVNVTLAPASGRPSGS